MDGLIDDDMLNAFAIVAPPEQLPARLAERCAGVIDRVSFLPKGLPLALLEAVRPCVKEHTA